MMSESITRNMYSSHGTINYPTLLHLVGHFRILYRNERNHEYQLHFLLTLKFVYENKKEQNMSNTFSSVTTAKVSWFHLRLVLNYEILYKVTEYSYVISKQTSLFEPRKE
jgi:hypothetical protein